MAVIPFHHERRVAFGDTDMAGIVHFSRLLDYVEEAEHAWFFLAGISPIGTGSLWPRLRMEADFLAPVRFGETARVTLRLERIGRSSLTFAYEIAVGERACCRGKWVICHSEISGDSSLRATPIPGDIRDVFEKSLS